MDHSMYTNSQTTRNFRSYKLIIKITMQRKNFLVYFEWICGHYQLLLRELQGWNNLITYINHSNIFFNLYYYFSGSEGIEKKIFLSLFHLFLFIQKTGKNYFSNKQNKCYSYKIKYINQSLCFKHIKVRCKQNGEFSQFIIIYY